jgi:hypothetical protein
MKAAFFFGSGISLASGAPTVGVISKKLLEGAWCSFTDAEFYDDECQQNPAGKSSGKAQLAQDFINIVKEKIDSHLMSRYGRRANYEDLYSAIHQIIEDEDGVYAHPLIADSVNLIKAASAHLWVGRKGQHTWISDNLFMALALSARDLIQWVVYRSLIKVSAPKGLDVISAVASKVGGLDIFSLNHDLLIERQLRDACVEFSDGFSEPNGDVVVFDASWKKNSKTVNLLKLHGSINWYNCEVRDSLRQKNYRVMRVDELPFIGQKDSSGNLLRKGELTPMFLTGTGIKEQSYGIGFFGDVFSEFRDRLSSHKTLICCGYGWEDLGINIRLGEWLQNQPGNKLVILYKDGRQSLERKDFWIWHFRMSNWLENGQVVVLDKWLDTCQIADLEPYFEA